MEWNASSLRSIPWWETKHQSSETQDLDAKQNANLIERTQVQGTMWPFPALDPVPCSHDVSLPWSRQGRNDWQHLDALCLICKQVSVNQQESSMIMNHQDCKYIQANQSSTAPVTRSPNQQQVCNPLLFLWLLPKRHPSMVVKAGGCVGNHSNLKGLFKRSCSGMISFWCKWNFVLQKV